MQPDSIEKFQLCVQFGWEHFRHLYTGEKLALAALAFVSLAGATAAVNRLLAGPFSWPRPRYTVRKPRRKKGFGLKQLMLLLLAFLPGGLAGTLVVYTVMGRGKWRRDALWIFAASFVPALLLLGMRAVSFSGPELREATIFGGTLGLVFGLLQIWILIKLLREWWGEPDECVAWWPPAALNLQMLALCACVYRLMA